MRSIKEMDKRLDEREQEIERQKEVINGMIDNEEKYLLEIIKLKSIIKEVREYIDKFIKANYEDIFNQEQKDYMIKILGILEKENK